MILCFLFSCKKEIAPPPPPPTIDSFLLHPPPVLDSLPLPLTTGTWWKYQRLDSSVGYLTPHFDSSIELISVIGKTPYVIPVVNNTNNIIRYRYDTVFAFMLEVKNLTKGTLDTNYAVYYDSSFNVYKMKNTDNLYLTLRLPQFETKLASGSIIILPFYVLNIYTVVKSAVVSVNNKVFNGCIYTEVSGTHFYSSVDTWVYHSTTFLKPAIGFVYWSFQSEYHSQYPSNNNWSVRRLIDYHVEP
ncbi:MAG: hypothetical protein WCH78_11425 [Bacteroidota bacterium]